VLSSSQDGRPFGHNRHPPKIGGGGELCPLCGNLDFHATQCGLGRGLPSYQVASWSIQPFGQNRHGPNFFEGGVAGSNLTQCRLGQGLPLYQLASWSIQPFGHNTYGPKIGGLCPFVGGGAGSPCNTMWPGRGLPACQVSSWSIQPFGHNTPMLQTDRQDRQRSNSIGQTVLQTVAQKSK